MNVFNVKGLEKDGHKIDLDKGLFNKLCMALDADGGGIRRTLYMIAYLVRGMQNVPTLFI